MYAFNNNVIYFDSFKHIQKEIKKFIGNKHIPTNIFRIQAYDSVRCGYSYIGFLDFLLKDKSLNKRSTGSSTKIKLYKISK